MKNQTLGRLLAASAVVAACALAPLPAAAYSSVVIFGDSLSDSGNNAQLRVVGVDPNQVITGNSYVPTKTYGSLTYSNGDVWATSFAAGLGLTALPSESGGTDYAYGGAVTSGGFPPALKRQITVYFDDVLPTPGQAAATLYVIAGGANNARHAVTDITHNGAPQQPTIDQTASAYASDIHGFVDQLQAAGAQHIVVWNTPDIGLTPEAGANGSAALSSQMASAMNTALAGALAGEPGVTLFDIYGLVDTVVASPGHYGLVNVTDACGAPSLHCDPATALFWDGIHPTSAGHEILAEAMLAAVPEPSVSWMLALGLVAIAIRRRIA